MKKYLVIAVITLLASCSKEKQCYTCEFGTVNGVTPPKEDYCGPMPYIKKINGVEFSTFCKLK